MIAHQLRYKWVHGEPIMIETFVIDIINYKSRYADPRELCQQWWKFFSQNSVFSHGKQLSILTADNCYYS